MFVCVCNAINCRTVRAAAAGGADSVASVFRSTGKTPQCGRCFDTMRCMIRETQASQDAALRIAAE